MRAEGAGFVGVEGVESEIKKVEEMEFDPDYGGNDESQRGEAAVEGGSVSGEVGAAVGVVWRWGLKEEAALADELSSASYDPNTART